MRRARVKCSSGSKRAGSAIAISTSSRPAGLIGCRSLLGHEGAGVVEEVGAGVATLAPGDRVVLGWRSPCGACRWCARGDVRRCRTPPGVRDRLHRTDGSRAFADVADGYVRHPHRCPLGSGDPDRRGAAAGAGLPDRLQRRHGRRLGPEHGGCLGGSARRRDRLRRRRSVGHPGRAARRRVGDLRARPRGTEARCGGGFRRNASRARCEARLRLRRRGPAGDRRARPRDARPCGHAGIHRNPSAGRSGSDRSPAALRPASPCRRLARRRSRAGSWTSHSLSNGLRRARSISPAWSRSGSGSRTWRRHSTTSRRAR